MTNLYQELSESIHGYPWHGPAIEIADVLQPSSKCMVTEIARQFGLLRNDQGALCAVSRVVCRVVVGRKVRMSFWHA